MKQIPLTKGRFAIVSDEDYEYLSIWNWVCSKGRGKWEKWRAYRTKTVNGKIVHIYLSREIMAYEIMDAERDCVVDHVNGDTLDNRRSNLRVCTQQQNMWNTERFKTKKHTSKYKGVHESNGRWTVLVGKRYVGCYGNEKDAAYAYNRACWEERGEFAVLNDVA